ncbi:MAG: ParA family protein [Rhodothermales bacterium]
MVILSVCNHKGGTGKTTTAIHFAAALGLSGYRVLVIDLDPQGFLTRTLGISEPSEETSSMMLFQPDRVLTDLNVLQLHGFDVLPASSRLTKLMRRLNKPTDVLWVKEAIGQASNYDFILIDTAAAVTVYSLNALVASRYAIIPVTPEYQPIIGAEQTFQTVSMVRAKLNPALNMPYFLFTQVDARKRAHYRYRQYLRNRYSDRVLNKVIRTSAALAITHYDGKTVFEHDPYSRGARDYANATDELLQVLLASPVPRNAHQPPGADAQVDVSSMLS